MRQAAFDYLLIGFGLALLLVGARLVAVIAFFPVPGWLDRTMAGIACAPIVGFAALLGWALLSRWST